MICQEMASKLPAELAGQVENVSYDIYSYCQPAGFAIRTDLASAPVLNTSYLQLSDARLRSEFRLATKPPNVKVIHITSIYIHDQRYLPSGTH